MIQEEKLHLPQLEIPQLEVLLVEEIHQLLLQLLVAEEVVIR